MIHVNLHVLLDIDVESRKQLPVVREERTTHTSVVNVMDLVSTQIALFCCVPALHSPHMKRKPDLTDFLILTVRLAPVSLCS